MLFCVTENKCYIIRRKLFQSICYCMVFCCFAFNLIFVDDVIYIVYGAVNLIITFPADCPVIPIGRDVFSQIDRHLIAGLIVR